MTIENVTKEVGEYIRDTLRNDSEFKTLLGITNVQNHIFFKRPRDQKKGFRNPRVVVEPRPSDFEFLPQTNFLVGDENFLVSSWVDDLEYDLILKVNSRIMELFNGQMYTFTDGSGNFLNFGEFKVFNKNSFSDPDKINTDKGEILLTLNIGGKK